MYLNKIKKKMYYDYFHNVILPIASRAQRISDVLERYFYKYKKSSGQNEVPYEIKELFFKVLHDTLKKCSGILCYTSEGSEFDNFIYYDLDEFAVSILVGCMDNRGFLLLDSRFIYARVKAEWMKQKSANRESFPELPECTVFFRKLYEERILNNGIFFRHPLYNIRLTDDEKKKQYFCISKETIGYDDKMVDWLDC